MKKTTSKHFIWKAFLPIGGALRADSVPEADVVWLMSRGIDGDALTVLRAVRHQLLPMIRSLEARHLITGFHFLIHDRTSGVPCPPEDSSAFIDLTLRYSKSSSILGLGRHWLFQIAGKLPPTPFLDEQCAWYLRLVDSCEGKSDLDTLHTVRQHLHYFANMAQVRIQ